MLPTSFTLPNGAQTTDYAHFKDAHAEHAAVQAKFATNFGATLSTPEGRRAAVDAMRAGALDKSGSVMVMPAAPRFQGGLSEADVDRRVDAAMTGATNRHGAEVFALPSSSAPVADALPQGVTRISFFGGTPQT